MKKMLLPDRKVFLLHSLTWLMFLLPLISLAQPKTVSGTVKDESGNPLQGATITIKNLSKTITSGIGGSFTLTGIPAGTYTVTASFAGHTSGSKEVKVGAGAVPAIGFVLPSTAGSLDEVVVIAYGTSSRKAVSNSIVSLSAKDVEDIPVASVSEAMVGLVPGADISLPSGEPGAAPVIRIRGVGSISAGNNPLYVVDGFPLNSSDNFNQISPSDIQSIQVLKDAAACAIYGSRGGNGIILVTTKHGSSGKAKFSFNANTGIQTVSKKVDLMNGDQFAAYLREGYKTANTALPAAYADSTTVFTNTDWQDVIFHSAVQSNYQISASGGSDASKYYISGSYYKQEGVIKGAGSDRFTLRANFDAKLTKKVKMGLSLAPTFSRTDTRPIAGSFNGSVISGGGASTVGAVVTDALLISPTLPTFIANGDYGQYSNTNGLQSINIYSPLATLDLYQDKTKSFRGLGYTFLDWEILKGLTFRTNFGAEILVNRRNWYIPATLATASSSTANLSNPVLAGINAQQSNSNNYNWLWENTLNYNTILGKNHNISLLAGYGSQRNTSEGSTVFGRASSYTNTAIDYVTAAGQILGSASAGANALVSWFGRVNYNFKDKYLLSAAIRNDGSSRFGSDNRYATFPSVSAAWRAGAEKFMDKFHNISELKIRGSYGVTGNNDIGDFSWQSYEVAANYVFGANAGSPVYGFVPNSVAIKNLTWETNKQVDAGLELGLFKNRIYLTVDAYQRNTTNLLLNRNVPAVIGLTTRVLNNVGEVRNRGLEIAITTQNFTGKFKWTTQANISFNGNKVLSLASDNDQILFDAVFGYTSSIRVKKGETLGSFYGYKQIGVYMDAADVANSPKWSAGSAPGDIKYADLSGSDGKPDGKIDANDIVNLGNALPKYTFGITNTLAYGNFQLNFTLQGRVGGQILNGTDRYVYNFYGKVNGPVSLLNRWKSETDPGDGWTPRVTTNAPTSLTSFSSHELYDASFLRIRNVSIRYNVPKALLARIRMQSATVFVTGQNLHTFSSYYGYNPEANIYGTSVNPTYGVDQGAYPLNRTFTLGVNLGF